MRVNCGFPNGDPADFRSMGTQADTETDQSYLFSNPAVDMVPALYPGVPSYRQHSWLPAD